MVNELYANNSVFAPDATDYGGMDLQFHDEEPNPYDEAAAQEDQDHQIVQGLQTGDLTIPEEGMQRLANNRNGRVQIQLSQNLTPEQKQNAIAQSFAADTEIRRASHPVPPEQVAQSPDAQKQKLIAALPPEARNKPWQYNPKEGNLQMPRGYKEAVTPGGGPVSDKPGEGDQAGAFGGGPVSDKPASVTDKVSPAGETPIIINSPEEYYDENKVPWGSLFRFEGELSRKPPDPRPKNEQHWNAHIITRPDGRSFQFIESKTGGKWEEMPEKSERNREFRIKLQQHAVDLQMKVASQRQALIDKWEGVWRGNNMYKEPDEATVANWEAKAKKVLPDPKELVEAQKMEEMLGGQGSAPQPSGQQPSQLPPGAKTLPDGSIQLPDGSIHRRKQ